jgi:hypothetical protein
MDGVATAIILERVTYLAQVKTMELLIAQEKWILGKFNYIASITEVV